MDFANWQQRFFPESQVYIAVCLLVAVAFFALAAFWWIRIPGGVHSSERVSQRRPWQTTLAFLATLACPLFVVLGVGYSLFPISPPYTLVLSSRIRSNDSAWDQDWKEQLDKIPPTAFVYDVGPFVDEVCTELVKKKQILHFDKSNPAAVGKLQQVVSAYLLEHAPTLSVIDPKRIDASPQSEGAASELPVWVVQSVEISVLKLLIEQHNVAQIVARFSDYSDGAFPETLLRELLAHDSRRFRPTDVQQVFVDLRRSELRLVSILAVRTSNDKTEVDVMIQANDPKDYLPKLFVTKDGNSSEYNCSSNSIPTGFSVHTFSSTHGTRPNLTEAVAYLQNDPNTTHRMPDDPKHLDEIEVRFKETHTGKFSLTFEKLCQDSDLRLKHWRDRMKEFGLDPTKIQMNSGSASKIVVTCANEWVVVSGDEVSISSFSDSESVTHARGRHTHGAAMGVLSLDKMQLKGTDFPKINWQSWQGSVEQLAENLYSGSYPMKSHPHPIIGVTNADGKTAHFIGLNFETEGMLNTQNEGSLAAWAVVVEAIYRMEVSRLAESQDRLDPSETPILLINDQTIQLLQSRTIAVNLIGYTIGILSFALFVLRGAMRGRK